MAVQEHTADPTPRVSVGLHVYNGADDVVEAIESVMAQTYREPRADCLRQRVDGTDGRNLSRVRRPQSESWTTTAISKISGRAEIPSHMTTFWRGIFGAELARLCQRIPGTKHLRNGTS